jgi:Holliday junction resolvase RusA-like endonuclease
MITFTIPGKPLGQQRPRFARVGKFVRAYDPDKSVSYKATLMQFAQAAGVKPIEGPVTVTVDAYMPRPQRLCRKRDNPGVLPATCKPDADNIGKIVCDALTGVAYADDAQVVELTVRKRYHAVGGVPCVTVCLALWLV